MMLNPAPARIRRAAFLHPLLALVLLLPWYALQAQTYAYKLTSTPDSAEVLLNGKMIGRTPFVAQVDWAQRSDSGLVFVFRKANYKDYTYKVIDKPRVKENYKDVALEKARPRFALDSNSVLVQFDKFMTEQPLDKVIGRNKTFYGDTIVWVRYSLVGVENFNRKADDVLGSAGFRTPNIQRNELFSQYDRRPQTPRYLIGARLIDIWVELGPSTLIGIKAKNWCTIEWKVFDKVQNKVVHAEVSRGEFEGKYTDPSELNVMMDLFRDAMENFLHGGALRDLVQGAGAATDPSNDPASAGPVAVLSPASLPAFQTMPEMIQYATQACITVRGGNLINSGVILSETGLAVTSIGVTREAGALTVILSNGTELDAEVLRVDEETGTALVQVKGSRFKALPPGDGLSVGLGEELVTIGTPKSLELGQSVARGILSGKQQHEGLTMLRTDIAVSPGNGGGPVIDKRGHVVGVVYTRMPQEGLKEGLVVPMEVVLKRLGVR